MSLKKIDFSNSIRSDDIQKNFDYLEKSIMDERLRMGGYGIVEGFSVEAIGNDKIKITKGTLIDKDGRDIVQEEALFNIASPEYIKKKATGLTVNNQGDIIIPDRPYSSQAKGFFTTGTYQIYYPTQELRVYDANNPTVSIRVIRIDRNKLTVDAAQWAGKKVNVEYQYTRNRMDTVFIHPQKGIEIERGITTGSVSHVDMEKYSDHYLLGLVEVVVDDVVELIIHEGKRTFRSIYVGENNELYLNGKIYKDTAIHFSIPEEPRENDLYCDIEENKMYVYTRNDIGFEWVLVTGVESVHTREVKIFAPEDNPSNLQTFMFKDDEVHLFYTPGNNQIEVIIENAVLMSDQFEEVVEGGELNSGRGFKLKTPLDRATYVEVRIFHPVQSSPIKNVFQRTATFTEERFNYYTPDNVDKIVDTSINYITEEGQLEVFVNGRRLQKSVEFIELLEGEDAYGKAPEKSNRFKVLSALTAGDVITYKISKNVYSYDHVMEIIENSEKTAAESIESIGQMREEMYELDRIVANRVGQVNQSISNMNEKIGDPERFAVKGALIEEEQVPKAITDKLFNKGFYQTVPCEPVVLAEGVSQDDYMQIYLVTSDGNSLLIRDIDYEIVDGEGEDLTIALRPEIINEEHSIHLTGIKFGQ